MSSPTNQNRLGKTAAKKIASAAFAVAIALTVQTITSDPASAGGRAKCFSTSYGTHCSKGVQVKFKCPVKVKELVKLAAGRKVLRTVVKIQNCVRTSEKKCFTSNRYGRCTPR